MRADSTLYSCCISVDFCPLIRWNYKGAQASHGVSHHPIFVLNIGRFLSSESMEL